MAGMAYLSARTAAALAVKQPTCVAEVPAGARTAVQA